MLPYSPEVVWYRRQRDLIGPRQSGVSGLSSCKQGKRAVGSVALDFAAVTRVVLHTVPMYLVFAQGTLRGMYIV